jgi:heptosyltransferase-2
MQKFLIIQTAFLGDVILATPVCTELKRLFPDAQIDILVRKGNESILANHPAISSVFTFDKKAGKLNALKKCIQTIRKEKYNTVINLHRFGSSGIITALSKANKKIGFAKNPFSFAYTTKIPHEIGNGTHEVERNLRTIAHLGADKLVRPSLFPGQANEEKIASFTAQSRPYFVLAPASVWFTKQLPIKHWITLASDLAKRGTVYLVGGKDDEQLCQQVIDGAALMPENNLAGKLNLLDSCALLQHAARCFVNDSGPMHMASAMNTPTTAFFCATIPAFGFGPLATDATIIETAEELTCRPCGLHGGKTCPEGHFKCGNTIVINSTASN